MRASGLQPASADAGSNQLHVASLKRSRRQSAKLADFLKSIAGRKRPKPTAGIVEARLADGNAVDQMHDAPALSLPSGTRKRNGKAKSLPAAVKESSAALLAASASTARAMSPLVEPADTLVMLMRNASPGPASPPAQPAVPALAAAPTQSSLPTAPNAASPPLPKSPLQLPKAWSSTQAAALASEAASMSTKAAEFILALAEWMERQASCKQFQVVALAGVHPSAIIGRECKIWWPLDGIWYDGHIDHYDMQKRRHKVRYEDGEFEWVDLGMERVQLLLAPGEQLAVCERQEPSAAPLQGRWPGGRVEAIDSHLVAGIRTMHGGGQSSIQRAQPMPQPGEAVWGHVKGFPWWPALVVDEDEAEQAGIPAGQLTGTVPMQFFGTHDHSRLRASSVCLFNQGIRKRYHQLCRTVQFTKSVNEVLRYLKEGDLPGPMQSVIEDELPQDTDANQPTPSAADTSAATMDITVMTPLLLPYEVDGLTVLRFGAVVPNNASFHSDRHIFPLGYEAVRMLPSSADAKALHRHQFFISTAVNSRAVTDLDLLTVVSISGDQKPLFCICAEGFPRISGTTPAVALQVLNGKRRKQPGARKQCDIRMGAAELFGFGVNEVAMHIKALPGAPCLAQAVSPSQPCADGVSTAGGQVMQPSSVINKDTAVLQHQGRCNVCFVAEEYADNLLMQCDRCRVMVHSSCYGPSVAECSAWLCSACDHIVNQHNDALPESLHPRCCLCPIAGGAMKPTTDSRWAHVACAMWIPETAFEDVDKLEPITLVSTIPKSRWKLRCSICSIACGACIQCEVRTCYAAYHPLCARGAGYCMEYVEEASNAKTTALVSPSRAGTESSADRLALRSYCPSHAPMMRAEARKMQSAIPAVSAKDYQPPQLQAGCARAEPYNPAARRGRREPDAVAAAMAKRLFVETVPYEVRGMSRHRMPLQPELCERMMTGSSNPTTNAFLSMGDRFRRMRHSLYERLAFGKSAIHGWGAFAKQRFRAGDMVVEYIGESVRPSVADLRERRCYDAIVGAGTYMFRVDDNKVVDATRTGSLAHLINHACEPNCFSKVVKYDGDDRIVIFAMQNVEVGEELTYDYRFNSNDERLPCNCGSAKCRGTVNLYEAEGFVIPLSQLQLDK
eukprot:jgi/Chlat1/2658/Chrsp178S02478